MQTTIDNFRQSTGGSLNHDSVEYLKNSTLVYSNSSSSSGDSTLSKRGLDISFSPLEPVLMNRDVSFAANGNQGGNATASTNGTSSSNNKATNVVYGIKGYVEQLAIPQGEHLVAPDMRPLLRIAESHGGLAARSPFLTHSYALVIWLKGRCTDFEITTANTFMTVLLFFAIVIAAIAVSILLFKVILETWALFGSFPKKLTSFRKRYWGMLAVRIFQPKIDAFGSQEPV